jgi:hypothetical protein
LPPLEELELVLPPELEEEVELLLEDDDDVPAKV